MVLNTTVDVRGAKSVCQNTTGYKKRMVSVCLAAKADGSKLKPFIAFKGANENQKPSMKNLKIDVSYKHLETHG